MSLNSRVPSRSDSSPLESAVDRGVGYLRSLWIVDARFWSVFFALQAVLVRNVFREGMLADNDSMGHYGFLRHFVEEFWPQTHALFGFSERYNFGVPYLLYNVPPGLTWAGALLVGCGFSAAAALKGIALVAYLSLGPIAAGMAKHLAPRSPFVGRFLALGMMLVSSELFGFEFFFRNGMLNAACALPLVLLGLRIAAGLDPNAPFLGRHVAALSAVFGSLLLVHVLSAYYLAIGVLALALGRGRSAGRSLIIAGFAVALGGALAAFWVLPSVPFAAREDAAYTWVRDSKDTVLALLDGSLITSYFGGFFPSFVRVSNVGLVVVVLAAIGIFEGIRQREVVVRGFAIYFALTFAIVLGPMNPIGHVLPGFERLLWYRFLTPAILALVVLASYGASRLVSVSRWRSAVTMALVLTSSIAFAGVLIPASRVQTTVSYREFSSSYERVVEALRHVREPGDRVFSEFLGFDVRQPPSVNVLRHLVPLDAHVEEIASWVYENNSTGRALLRSGPFWYDSVAIADSARDLGVRFVVAGSDALRFALDHDARFESLFADDLLALFRVRDPMPRVTVRALSGVERRVASLRHGREGSGYGYVADLSEEAREGDVLVVRTNVEGWRVTADGSLVVPHATKEGFLGIPLHPGVRHLEAHWAVPSAARTGAWISLVALIGVGVIATLSRGLRFPIEERFGRRSELAGLALCAVVAVAAAVRSSRVDFSRFAFGLADGLRVSAERGAALEIGTWHDLHSDGLLTASRHGEAYALTISAFSGVRVSFDTDAPAVRVRPSTLPENAATVVRAGETLEVPDVWLATAAASASKPGRALELIVETTDHGPLRRVSIDGGVYVLEAESFRNTTEDGGGDGFYGPSHPPYAPLGGNTVVVHAKSGRPTRMQRTVDVPSGHYEVFVLLRAAPSRDAQTRATIAVSFGDLAGELRAVDGADLPRDHDGGLPHARFTWRSLGVAKLRGPVTMSVAASTSSDWALAEIDAFALVPQR
jgi:6-pyruvoyl-tetrahydropterin synthase related domain